LGDIKENRIIGTKKYVNPRLYKYHVNVNIRILKKWEIIMYKKWPKTFQNPLPHYYLNTEF